MASLRIFGIGLGLTALSLSTTARGDAADKALAESLFQEGRQLIDAGRVEAACEKFAESQRLDAALGTLLNLAECHAKAGKTASAWAEFRELEQLSRQAGQTTRAEYAASRASELQGKLSFARLGFPKGATISSIRLDDRELGRAAWRSKLPLDPGRHVVLVTTPKGTATTHFELSGAAGEQHFELELPQAKAGEHRPSQPQLENGPERVPTSEGGNTTRTVGYVSLGVGVLGLGAGAFFTARALSLKGESDDRCAPAGCDAEGLSKYEDARDSANLATLSFAVGGVALAAGTGLVLWAASDGSTTGQLGVGGRF